MPTLNAASEYFYLPIYSLSRHAEAFPVCGPVIRSNSLGVFTTTTGTDETFVAGATGFATFTLLTGNATFATFGATPTTLEMGTHQSQQQSRLLLPVKVHLTRSNLTLKGAKQHRNSRGW